METFKIIGGLNKVVFETTDKALAEYILESLNTYSRDIAGLGICYSPAIS